jgi:hypothetical protein
VACSAAVDKRPANAVLKQRRGCDSRRERLATVAGVLTSIESRLALANEGLEARQGRA